MTKNNFSAYNSEVLRHFTDPKNYGIIKNPDGVGELGNMKCGDIMKIYIRLDSKKEKIEDIKFETFGCIAAIASSDVLCDLAKGKKLEQAKKINNKDIIKKLKGLPNIKFHCSVLGAGALKKAIEDFENKK
jgi:nitrogen fixation protein NifU and related proteins